MAEAEVKIKATMDFAGDYDALDKQVEALKKLRAEAREMERMGAPREAAKITRKANAMERSIDREGARLLRLEDDEDKRAKKAPIEATMDRLSRGLVEEAEARAEGNHKAADAMAKETALMQRALTLQRTRNVSAEEAMMIARQESALKSAGVGVAPTASAGSMAMAAGGTAALTAIAAATVGTVMQQMMSREGLANQQRASRAGTAYDISVLSGIRGSSGQLQAEAWAAQDEAERIRRERPQLETDRKWDTIKGGASGAMWGMGIGAAVGSLVPVLGTVIGAGVGAGIGAAVQGVPTWLAGGNKIEESKQNEKLAAERGAEMQAAARKRFTDGIGGLELDTLRQRGKRTLAGYQAARENELAAAAFGKYESGIYASATPEEAREMAELTYQNALREQQSNAQALVGAHTGGAGIAAAARWATMTSPLAEGVGTKMDVLIASVNQGNQNAERKDLAK